MKQKAKEVKLMYLNRRQETEIKDHSTMVKHLRKDRVNKMKHVLPYLTTVFLAMKLYQSVEIFHYLSRV